MVFTKYLMRKIVLIIKISLNLLSPPASLTKNWVIPLDSQFIRPLPCGEQAYRCSWNNSNQEHP